VGTSDPSFTLVGDLSALVLIGWRSSNSSS